MGEQTHQLWCADFERKMELFFKENDAYYRWKKEEERATKKLILLNSIMFLIYHLFFSYMFINISFKSILVSLFSTFVFSLPNFKIFGLDIKLYDDYVIACFYNPFFKKE